jgi:hypothetical protein
VKQRRLYFVFICSMLLCALKIPYALAEEKYDYLIINEDFEELNLDNWKITQTDSENQGEWSILLHEGSNVLSLQRGLDAQLRDLLLENYTIQVRSKFGVFDQAGHISFRISEAARYFIRYDGRDLRLVKSTDTLVEPVIVDCNLEPNTWYTIKIICNGDRITVYIDDELYIDYIDNESLQYGGVGLESGFESHLYFDDVMIFSTQDVYVKYLLSRVEHEINKGRESGYDTSKAEEKLDEAFEASNRDDYSLAQALAEEALRNVYLTKVDDIDSSDVQDSISIDWTLQTITGLVTIGAAVVGVFGWMYRKRLMDRRVRILITKRLEEVDDVYSRFKMNSIKCESELIRLKGEILHEFKEGLIDEQNFETLDRRIDEYLKEIREEIQRDRSNN